MKHCTKLVTLFCLVAFVGSVQAEEACKEACKSACKGCALSSKALADLPAFVYKIGDETTDNPAEAAKISRNSGNKIQFIGAGKEFEVESDAFAFTVAETEKFVAKFAAPKKCEVSGQTTVAGKKVCCDVAASQVAAIAKKAMDSVQVSYRVGKTSVCCPDAAKALAKKTGEKVVQCVGNDASGCGLTTRLKLAQARYIAIVEAIAASDKKATEKSET